MENTASVKTLPLSCELIEYSILHLQALVGDEKTEAIPLSIRPDIRFEIGKREYRAFVHCKYSIENFAFSCGIEGDFKFGEEISNKNMIMAWYNACTMLYGIMRGIFSTSVNQAIHKSYFLPSVMMINEIQKRINCLLQKQPKEDHQSEEEQLPKQPTADKVEQK